MTLPPADILDLIIIGAGPVGLYAAFYAGLRRLRIRVIDSLPEVGGQLTALYPEKYIFDVPGFPKILARDLVQQLRIQAESNQPEWALGQTVLEIKHDPVSGVFALHTTQGVHQARAVLIGIGAGAFHPRKLTLPNTAALEDHSLFYLVRQKADFHRQRTLIIGGGDSALDWALNLGDTAREITLIHRRNQFRAHEDTLQRVLAAGVKVLTFKELQSVEADGTTLRAVTIFDNRSKATTRLEMDRILVQVGFLSTLGRLAQWGLRLEGNAIAVDQHMETSVPLIFAAGDICTYPGKIKLIATGFGEAAIAVNTIKTRLDPKAKLFPGHSSENLAQDDTTATLV
jgi:thioredoxin reductase